MIRFSEWLENRTINEAESSIIKAPFAANPNIDLTSNIKKVEMVREGTNYKLYINVGGKLFSMPLDQKMYSDLLVAKTAGTASKVMQAYSRPV